MLPASPVSCAQVQMDCFCERMHEVEAQSTGPVSCAQVQTDCFCELMHEVEAQSTGPAFAGEGCDGRA